MSYRDRIRIVASIADVHIGVKAITADEVKYQLYERFVKPVSELSMLDLITINGDLAHLSLPFNSKLAEVYIWFVDSLVTIAKKKNAAVIIVKGTISHDFDQLENLRVYTTDAEVYIINEPTIVETKGMRICCLPDIHVKDKSEETALYAYPDNYFDMTMGHGSVTETQFVKQESEHAISKNIVYNTKQLIRMTKGPVYFGHIHTFMHILKHFYYLSSFIRFAHGEEGDKGGMLTAYVPETGKYLAERMINDLAFNFNAYDISHQRFDRTEVEDLIKKVEKFVKEYKVDRLQLNVQYINSDVNTAKLQIMRKYFERDKRVTFRPKAISMKEAEYIEKAEATVESDKKYLLDDSIPFTEKLQRFIEEEYKVKLPLTKIDRVLLSDDLLIRDREGTMAE